MELRFWRRFCWWNKHGDFQVALVVKKKTLPAVQEIRDTDLIPGSGRSPGVRNSSWLQYSCLKNSMERGIWQAAVHGAAESQTQPSDEHSTHTGICTRKQFTYKWALMPSCKMGTLF